MSSEEIRKKANQPKDPLWKPSILHHTLNDSKSTPENQRFNHPTIQFGFSFTILVEFESHNPTVNSDDLGAMRFPLLIIESKLTSSLSCLEKWASFTRKEGKYRWLRRAIYAEI
jgi:hypothetical protein